MAKKPASIRDVAKRAGVSTATVSNVFSGAKAVNPDLAGKVRAAAADLGYQINRAASVLRSGRSSIVTVLVPDLSDPFFTTLITEIETRAEGDGYEIIVGNSRDSVDVENSRLEALLSWNPSGLIVVPCSDDLPAVLKSGKAPPFVLADRVTERTVADTISIDNRDAGKIAAEHLCQLGHRRIVVAASDTGLEVIRNRIAGTREEALRWGGTVDVVEVGPVPDIGAVRLRDGLEGAEMPSVLTASRLACRY